MRLSVVFTVAGLGAASGWLAAQPDARAAFFGLVAFATWAWLIGYTSRPAPRGTSILRVRTVCQGCGLIVTHAQLLSLPGAGFALGPDKTLHDRCPRAPDGRFAVVVRVSVHSPIELH